MGANLFFYFFGKFIENKTSQQQKIQPKAFFFNLIHTKYEKTSFQTHTLVFLGKILLFNIRHD